MENYEWTQEADGSLKFKVFEYYARIRTFGTFRRWHEVTVYYEGKRVDMPEVRAKGLRLAKAIGAYAVMTAWHFGLKPE